MALELFGSLMGGDTTTGINALLTPAQRALMNQQANLSAAAALLQAGGPSRQRVGLGQALGAALQAGQGAYQQARAGSLQDLLLGEKLKEAQMLRDYQAALRGQPPTSAPAQAEAPLNAAQASLLSQTAPVSTAGPVGPTMQRAAIMDAAQVAPPAPAAMSDTERRFQELMRKADIANQFNKPEDAQKFLDQAFKIKPPEEFSTSLQYGTSAQGTPISFVLSKSGGMKLMDVQRNPEFSYQDTGSYVSVRDKNTNREIERIPKSMTPGEVASNRIAMGNLGVAQGNLALSRAAFERGAYDRVETPEGLMLVPKTPGGVAVPLIGPDGKPLKGVSGGQATEGERKAGTLLQRLQLAEQQITGQGAGATPGMLTGVTPRVLKPEERKRVEDAQLEFLDAALTLSTGAAYTREQLLGAQQSYFPKFGDDPGTLAEKDARRKQLIESARMAAGRMSSGIPALPTTVAPPANRKPLSDIFLATGGR